MIFAVKHKRLDHDVIVLLGPLIKSEDKLVGGIDRTIHPLFVIVRLDRTIQKKKLDSPNKSGNDIRWGSGNDSLDS